MKALLLSAGLGTRLRPFTEKRPKPLIPFLGRPLVDYSLYYLQQAGCQNMVVNLHHLGTQIETYLLQKPEIHAEFSWEHETPLGSGGGISHARELLESEEAFFAINSDEFYISQDALVLQRLWEKHKEEKALATLWLTPHPELFKSLKPVWVNQAGEVRGFGDHKIDPTEELTGYHYTGNKVFSSEIFEHLPEGESNIFYDVLIESIRQGKKVHAFIEETLWWETGYPDKLLEAHRQAIPRLKKALEDSEEHFPLLADFQSHEPKFLIDEETTAASLSGWPEGDDKTIVGTVFVGSDVTFVKPLSLKNTLLESQQEITQEPKALLQLRGGK